MSGEWLRFEQLRWDGPPPACVRCGLAGRCSLLPGLPAARRVWRCAACRGRFSVLTGTLLERTRVPLPVWAAVAADVVAGDVAVRPLARRHGITPETARLLIARMTAVGGGTADETLTRLLRLPASDVARIRRSTPPRRASRYGPSGDYA